MRAGARTVRPWLRPRRSDTPEQLVRALADQRQLHVPRGPAGEERGRHPGRVRERLAHHADELRHALLSASGSRGPASSRAGGAGAPPPRRCSPRRRTPPGSGACRRGAASGREILRDRRDQRVEPAAQEHAALDLGVGLARTASRNTSSNPSTVGTRRAAVVIAQRQYRRCVTPPRSTTTTSPGATLRTSVNGVSGAVK